MLRDIVAADRPVTLRSLRVAAPVIAAAVVVAWLVVYTPPKVSIPVLAGTLAAMVWLLDPIVALYALVGLSPFTLSFAVGSINDIRLMDGVLVALGVSVVTSSFRAPLSIQRKTSLKTTFFSLWAALLAWSSFTFLVGPANQYFLGGLARDGWFLYAAVWRWMIPFALVYAVLESRAMAIRLVDLAMAISGGIGVHAILMALQSGEEASGIFDTKNQLAGYLIVVLPFAAGGALMATTWSRRALYGLCGLVLFRALWLTGSRGALVGLVASFVPMAFILPRKRIVAACCAGALALVVVLALWSDILDRPNVQRFFTLSHASEEGNFKWRQEQWAFFIERLKERPWLGMGSDVMESLLELDRAATPHNGYLAMAFRGGIPMAILWCSFLLLLAGVSFVQALGEPHPESRGFWVGLLGCLFALMTHNTVEVTILMPQIESLLWIFAAVALFLTLPEEAPRAVRSGWPHV